MVTKVTAIALLALSLTCAVHAGMYNEYVTDLTPDNFDDLVIKSTETWLIKFYAPWCGHCQSSAPAFSKAAKKLDGVARLGVVNCDEHKALAQRFGIQGFPTIKVFKGEGKKARRPSDYNQGRTSKAFVDHIKYIMPSFVARVKSSGVDAFFKDLVTLPHVLLFTDKTSTSPLYKGMSAKFKGKVSFGEVRKSDAGEMANKFSVSAFPTLLAFEPGTSDAENAVPFTGSMDPKSLAKFFDNISQGNVTDTGDGSSETTERKQSEKVFAQPKAYSGDIYDIIGTKQYKELCDARMDGRMCGLLFLPGGASHPLHEQLKPVAEKYQYDNLAFAVMDSTVEGGDKYAELFSLNKEVGGFIVMRARKRKYTVLSEEPTTSLISNFLDHIVSGDARWKKLSDELPEWNVPESGESMEGGEKSSNASSDSSGEEDSGQCGTEPPKDGESCGGSKEDL